MGLCAASFRLPSQLCGQRTLWVPWTKDDMLHCAESLSRVRLVVTPWTVALQAPLSMGFSRQAYWSGLPCPPPGGLPEPGIEHRSPTLQVDSLYCQPPEKPMVMRWMLLITGLAKKSGVATEITILLSQVVCLGFLIEPSSYPQFPYL